MTIQDPGSIGELVAAIATIATLAYLALQLRQNTATVRHASAASQSTINHGLNTLLAQDAEVNRILGTGLADPAKLDEAEGRRFDAVLQLFAENVQQSWRFHHDGVIDDATWSSQHRSLVWLTSQTGFRPYWERRSSTQHPGFASYVHELFEQNSSASNRRSGAA
jgi:hypothetical protein